MCALISWTLLVRFFFCMTSKGEIHNKNLSWFLPLCIQWRVDSRTDFDLGTDLNTIPSSLGFVHKHTSIQTSITPHMDSSRSLTFVTIRKSRVTWLWPKSVGPVSRKPYVQCSGPSGSWFSTLVLGYYINNTNVNLHAQEGELWEKREESNHRSS